MFLLKIGIQLENHIKNQRENVEICQKVLNMELQMMKI